MSRFSVVMLVCADLVRSRTFYKDVMGLRVHADHMPQWIEFELSLGTLLGLHPKSDLLAVRPGSLQLGFTVPNVDKFVADCVGMGVPVFQDPYEDATGRVAVIGDPDGYPIQIGTHR